MTDRSRRWSDVHRDLWTPLVQEVQIGVRLGTDRSVIDGVWDAVLTQVDTTPYNALGETIYLGMERHLMLTIGP